MILPPLALEVPPLSPWGLCGVSARGVGTPGRGERLRGGRAWEGLPGASLACLSAALHGSAHPSTPLLSLRGGDHVGELPWKLRSSLKARRVESELAGGRDPGWGLGGATTPAWPVPSGAQPFSPETVCFQVSPRAPSPEKTHLPWSHGHCPLSPHPSEPRPDSPEEREPIIPVIQHGVARTQERPFLPYKGRELNLRDV